MANIISIRGPEITVTTPTDVSGAKTVRILNGAASGANTEIVVTHKDSIGTIIGAITMLAGDVVYLDKAKTDTIEAATSGTGTALVTPVALRG